MKSLKKLLPALALTLMIAGTLTASAIGTKKTNNLDQWYGLPTTDPLDRVPLSGPPSIDDCDHSNNSCYVHVTDDGEEEYPGGFYTGQ